MDYRYAVLTSKEEVNNYFSGKRWYPKQGPSNFERNIQDEYYIVRLSPGQSTFMVKIESYDDPMDRAETKSPVRDPIKFVQDFLKDENVLKVSNLSSKMVMKYIGKENIVISSIIDGVLLRSMKVASVDEKVLSEAKKIGWEVEDESESSIELNVFDIYKVTIESTGIDWKYQFEVKGTDDATVHGTSSDPIIKYREWYKNKRTVSALDQIKREKEESLERENEVRDNQETVKPNRRK